MTDQQEQQASQSSVPENAMETGASPRPLPIDIEEQNIELQAKLIGQEHRFFALIKNWASRGQWDKKDKRRKAASLALFLNFFSPGALALALGGFAAIVSAVLLFMQVMLMNQQNFLVDEQTDEIKLQNRLLRDQFNAIQQSSVESRNLDLKLEQLKLPSVINDLRLTINERQNALDLYTQIELTTYDQSIHDYSPFKTIIFNNIDLTGLLHNLAGYIPDSYSIAYESCNLTNTNVLDSHKLSFSNCTLTDFKRANLDFNLHTTYFNCTAATATPDTISTDDFVRAYHAFAELTAHALAYTEDPNIIGSNSGIGIGVASGIDGYSHHTRKFELNAILKDLELNLSAPRSQTNSDAATYAPKPALAAHPFFEIFGAYDLEYQDPERLQKRFNTLLYEHADLHRIAYLLKSENLLRKHFSTHKNINGFGSTYAPTMKIIDNYMPTTNTMDHMVASILSSTLVGETEETMSVETWLNDNGESVHLIFAFLPSP